jgi:hypothetical protein
MCGREREENTARRRVPGRGLEPRAGVFGFTGLRFHVQGNEDDGGLMDFGARFYDARVGFVLPQPNK